MTPCISDEFARLPALLRCLFGNPGKTRTLGCSGRSVQRTCFTSGFTPPVFPSNSWIVNHVLSVFPRFRNSSGPYWHGLFSVTSTDCKRSVSLGEAAFLFFCSRFKTSPVDRASEETRAFSKAIIVPIVSLRASRWSTAQAQSGYPLAGGGGRRQFCCAGVPPLGGDASASFQGTLAPLEHFELEFCLGTVAHRWSAAISAITLGARLTAAALPSG